MKTVFTRGAALFLTLALQTTSAASVLEAGQAPQDPSRLADIKVLYEAAEYDRALAAADRIAPAASPEETRDLEVYETLCLLALGNKTAANARIEAVIRREPLYSPSADMPNRLRTLVEDVRGRIGPSLAQEHYLSGKALFEAGTNAKAIEEFSLVLRLIDAVPSIAQGEHADLKILAGGFHDLAERAIAPAKAATPVPAPPPVRVAEAASAPLQSSVEPPVVITQDVPRWPASLASQRRADPNLGPRSSVLEVTIGADGLVKAARLTKSIQPFYDALVLSAARQWKYRPATSNGVPVEFVKRLAINIQ